MCSSAKTHYTASGSADPISRQSSFLNRLFRGTGNFSNNLKDSKAAGRASSRHHFKPAFTLVELLVCITIIIVLAGMIFVLTRNLKQGAESVVATKRIQSLGHANAAYAAEHNGKYVPVFAFSEDRSFQPPWFYILNAIMFSEYGFLPQIQGRHRLQAICGVPESAGITKFYDAQYNQKYLETLIGNTAFLANPEQYEGSDGYPESVLDPIVIRSKKRFWSRLSTSFGYNQENMPGGDWGQAGTARSHTISSVNSAELTFQFITATDWTAKYTGRNLWIKSPVEGRTTDGKIAFRHKGGKALAVFYDGHVEAISPEDIRRFDNRGGGNHVFWGGRQR